MISLEVRLIAEQLQVLFEDLREEDAIKAAYQIVEYLKKHGVSFVFGAPA